MADPSIQQQALEVWPALIAAWTWLNVVLAVYGLVIGLLGLPRSVKPQPARRLRRFAILIPAHNEAAVLPALLASLKAQTYPADHFEVFVAADDCHDETASIAGRLGATVFERRDPEHPGKTWNLRWAIGRIPLEHYAGIVLFDADNLAHRDFLVRLNEDLEAHPESVAIQGYLDVKNPDDTWVTRANAICYWFTNRFWQLARCRAGLSSAAGGTGLFLCSEHLLAHGWQVSSLTDDLELTMRLVTFGQRVRWCEQAIVYDEKPLTLSASIRQRLRWAQGHYWVLAHCAPALLRQFFGPRAWITLDALVYLTGPLRVLSALVFSVAGLTLGAREGFSSETYGGPFAAAALVSWLGVTLAYSLMVVTTGPAFHAGRLTLRYAHMVVGYAVFSLSWLPVWVIGLWRAGDQRRWAKTEHSRAILLSELDRGDG